MASKVPPDDAAQPKTLPAQHNKLLRKRLAIWGAVTATSVVVALGALLIAPGSERVPTASSGAMPDIPVAAAPVPPAELRVLKQASDALKQATEQATTQLANVERNTAATRAETKRLADKVNKLTSDSFRFTGRLANIEQQIDGITGSIRKEAQEAAAQAVAKAMPIKPGYSAFDSPAPIISPPATTPPKLSLLLPASRPGAPDNLTTATIKTPGTDAKPAAASGSESMAEAELKAGGHKTGKPSPRTTDVKAEVGIRPNKGAIERRPHKVLTPAAEAKLMADKAIANKAMAEKSMATGKTAKPPTRIARAAPTSRRHDARYQPFPRTSYGVDLGSANSLTVAKAQWAAVKANFGPILRGLQPIAVRNHRILTSGSYRLVAAHLSSWAAAKSVCERLAKGKLACQPVKFEGEKVIWQ